MGKTINVTKIQVLKFIAKQGMIEPWQLWQYFYWTPSYGAKRLSLLKKQKLVINLLKGRWELTEDGYRRLDYYAKKQSPGNKRA